MSDWEHHPKVEVPGRAAVLRAALRNRARIQEVDPWLPYPQQVCCFGFGADDRPLPAGALFHLWDAWPASTGTCPSCNKEVYGEALAAQPQRAGVVGVCVGCDHELVHWLAEPEALAREARQALRRTPFPLRDSQYGEIYEGPARPLLELLRRWERRGLPSLRALEIETRAAARLLAEAAPTTGN